MNRSSLNAEKASLSPGFMNKSWICKSIQGLGCAYLLGKMVEAAIFKQNTIEFHSYSTSPCGFSEKIFAVKHRYTGRGFLERYLS